MQRFPLIQLVGSFNPIRRPLGTFEGEDVFDAIGRASKKLDLERFRIDAARADTDEPEQVARLDSFEEGRALGMVVLGHEGHGKYHRVGDANTRPKYTCAIDDYALVSTPETHALLGQAHAILTELAAMRADESLVMVDLVRDLARRARELVGS